MFSYTKLFVFLSFTLSVASLVTPHGARTVLHHHRSIAPHVAVPIARDLSVASIQKRTSKSRCKNRSSTSVKNALQTHPSNPGEPSSTSSKVVQPTHDSKNAAPNHPEPSPTKPANNPSATNSGQGTYFSPGLGACGITNSASQHIVAVSHALFDSHQQGSNPNDNPLCNKQIYATYGGKSTTVTVTDRCVGCQYYDLDFSPAAFQDLADESLGRIDIEWGFV